MWIPIPAPYQTEKYHAKHFAWQNYNVPGANELSWKFQIDGGAFFALPFVARHPPSYNRPSFRRVMRFAVATATPLSVYIAKYGTDPYHCGTRVNPEKRFIIAVDNTNKMQWKSSAQSHTFSGLLGDGFVCAVQAVGPKTSVSVRCTWLCVARARAESLYKHRANVCQTGNFVIHHY